MQLGSLEVADWLDRGPAHQLFVSDDNRLVYRVLPTASKEVRRGARGLVDRVVEALNEPGAKVPSNTQIHASDESGTDYELLFSCDNPTGRSTMNLSKPLPPVLALGLASRLLAGLAPIHELGLYHAALTPGRILLDDQGEPILTDLGMAYLTEADADRRLAPSVPGFSELYPIPAFIPPEVFNWKPLTPASDIFLIAALVYRWMTGSPAHEGERVMDIYSALRDGRRKPFPQLPANLNLAAIRVLDKAFDPEPDRRPSGDEVSAALRPFAGIALGPLAAQAGQAQLYSAGFNALQPEDAPGPPGSPAEQRRQEALKRATLQLEVMKNQRDAAASEPLGPRRGTKGRKRRSNNLWSWVVVIALLAGIAALTPFLLEQIKQRTQGGGATPAPRTNNANKGTVKPAPSPGPKLTIPAADAATAPAQPDAGISAAAAAADAGPAGAGDPPGVEPGGLVVSVGGGRVRLDIKRRQPEIEIHQSRYLTPENLPPRASGAGKP